MDQVLGFIADQCSPLEKEYKDTGSFLTQMQGYLQLMTPSQGITINGSPLTNLTYTPLLKNNGTVFAFRFEGIDQFGKKQIYLSFTITRHSVDSAKGAYVIFGVTFENSAALDLPYFKSHHTGNETLLGLVGLIQAAFDQVYISPEKKPHVLSDSKPPSSKHFRDTVFRLQSRLMYYNRTPKKTFELLPFGIIFDLKKLYAVLASSSIFFIKMKRNLPPEIFVSDHMSENLECMDYSILDLQQSPEQRRANPLLIQIKISRIDSRIKVSILARMKKKEIKLLDSLFEDKPVNQVIEDIREALKNSPFVTLIPVEYKMYARI